LRQIIHALLTQIDALQLRNILLWCLADPLDDDGRICFKNDPVIDNLVNS